MCAIEAHATTAVAELVCHAHRCWVGNQRVAIEPLGVCVVNRGIRWLCRGHEAWSGVSRVEDDGAVGRHNLSRFEQRHLDGVHIVCFHTVSHCPCLHVGRNDDGVGGVDLGGRRIIKKKTRVNLKCLGGDGLLGARVVAHMWRLVVAAVLSDELGTVGKVVHQVWKRVGRFVVGGIDHQLVVVSRQLPGNNLFAPVAPEVAHHTGVSFRTIVFVAINIVAAVHLHAVEAAVRGVPGFEHALVVVVVGQVVVPIDAVVERSASAVGALGQDHVA